MFPEAVATPFIKGHAERMSELAELADLIRSHRPPNARAYYLNSYNGRFPTTGGWELEPFTAPKAPGGSYSLHFLTQPIGGSTVSPLYPHLGAPTITVPAAATAGNVSQSLTVKVESQPERRAERFDPIDDHPEHIANRVEFEKIRMADQTIKAKHLLGKNLGQVEEMAGTLLYAKAWRQEAERTMAGRDRDREKLTDEILRLTALVVHERETRQPTPPPPPDHFTPTLGLLGQILGMAGAALSPAIAKQQKEKGDPVLDAVVGSASEEPNLATLKAELAKAMADLEAKKAAKAAETKSAAPAQPSTEPAAPAAAAAPPQTNPTTAQLDQLTMLAQRLVEALESQGKPPPNSDAAPATAAAPAAPAAPAASAAPAAPAARPRATARRKEPTKKKPAPKALPARRGGKS